MGALTHLSSEGQLLFQEIYRCAAGAQIWEGGKNFLGKYLRPPPPTNIPNKTVSHKDIIGQKLRNLNHPFFLYMYQNRNEYGLDI